jgi:3'-phosphoadenosine 5'-phosphosulfate sulfotransferase (PAPS reductase)/FAD synthetase
MDPLVRTELDVWQYILREPIPIVPLCFAKPSVKVSWKRLPLQAGEPQ